MQVEHKTTGPVTFSSSFCVTRHPQSSPLRIAEAQRLILGSIALCLASSSLILLHDSSERGTCQLQQLTAQPQTIDLQFCDSTLFSSSPSPSLSSYSSPPIAADFQSDSSIHNVWPAAAVLSAYVSKLHHQLHQLHPAISMSKY